MLKTHLLAISPFFPLTRPKVAKSFCFTFQHLSKHSPSASISPLKSSLIEILTWQPWHLAGPPRLKLVPTSNPTKYIKSKKFQKGVILKYMDTVWFTIDLPKCAFRWRKNNTCKWHQHLNLDHHPSSLFCCIIVSGLPYLTIGPQYQAEVLSNIAMSFSLNPRCTSVKPQNVTGAISAS